MSGFKSIDKRNTNVCNPSNEENVATQPKRAK